MIRFPVIWKDVRSRFLDRMPSKMLNHVSIDRKQRGQDSLFRTGSSQSWPFCGSQHEEDITVQILCWIWVAPRTSIADTHESRCRRRLARASDWLSARHLNHYTTKSGRHPLLPALHVGPDAARRRTLLITMGHARHVPLPS